MKKLISSLLAFMLILGFSGCGNSKPSKDDIIKSAQTSISAFKDMGYDLESYVNIDDVKIVDSYKQNGLYIIKGIPHILIKKDLDKKVLKSKFSGLTSAYINKIIAMFEALKLYSNGKINKLQMKQYTVIGIPEGILKKGDEFNGLESTYKFRKTDNGWKAID